MSFKNIFYTFLFFIIAVCFLLTESICDNLKICSIFDFPKTILNLPMIEPYASAGIYFKAGYFFALILSPISAVLCFCNIEVKGRKIFREFLEKKSVAVRVIHFFGLILIVFSCFLLFSMEMEGVGYRYRFVKSWLPEVPKSRFFSALFFSLLYFILTMIWLGIVFEVVNFFNIFRKG